MRQRWYSACKRDFARSEPDAPAHFEPAARCLTDAVSDYAVRLHSALGADHVAASPLGAYLLLAAVAPAATGQVRAEPEHTLGRMADEAAGFLSALLASLHPAVATAIAIWNDPQCVSEALDRWRRALPKRTTAHAQVGNCSAVGPTPVARRPRVHRVGGAALRAHLSSHSG